MKTLVAIVVAVAVLWVATRPDETAVVADARAEVESSIEIVRTALELRGRGAVIAPYVTTLARQNAAAARAAADRLESAGARDLAARGHEVAALLEHAGDGDPAATRARLGELRHALETAARS